MIALGLFALVGWGWAIRLYRQRQEQQQVIAGQARLVAALKDANVEKDSLINVLLAESHPIPLALWPANVTADQRYAKVH